MGFIVPAAISIGLRLVAGLFTSKKDITQKAPDPNLRVPKSKFNEPLPRVYGRVRVEGNKIYPKTAQEMYEVEVIKKKQKNRGGKGGGGGSTTVETKNVYGYFITALCQGRVAIEQVYLNGNKYNWGEPFLQDYAFFADGNQTTAPSVQTTRSSGIDSLIPYRNVPLLGFDRIPLSGSKFGNAIPQQVGAVIYDTVFGAAPNLGQVVGDICRRAGLSASEYDITELTPILLNGGFLLNESGNGYRAALEQLMNFYLFTAVQDTDGTLLFKRFWRNDETPYIVNSEDMLPVSSNGLNNQAYIKTKSAPQDLPKKLVIKFYDKNRDYEENQIIQHFNNPTATKNSVELDSGLYTWDTFVQAQAVNIERYLRITQQYNYKFRLPISLIQFCQPLNLIQLPNGDIVQIHRMNPRDDFTIEVDAKLYYPSIALNIDVYPPVQQNIFTNPNATFDPTPDPGEPAPPVEPGVGTNPDYTDDNLVEEDPNTTDPGLSTDNIVTTNTTPTNLYLVNCPRVELAHPSNSFYTFSDGECVIQYSANSVFESATTYDHNDHGIIANAITTLPPVTSENPVNSDTLDVTLIKGELNEPTYTTEGELLDSKNNLAFLGRRKANRLSESVLTATINTVQLNQNIEAYTYGVIFFTSGVLAGQEFYIGSVTTDTITFFDDLPSIPSPSDTVELINDHMYTGEVLQFGTVTPLGGDDYRLGDLKRGLLGSFPESDHNGTEILLVFNDAENESYYSLLIDNNYINRKDLDGTLYLRSLVSNQQNLAETPIYIYQPTSANLSPATPTNLASIQDKNSNILITWDYEAGFSLDNNSQTNVTFKIDISQTSGGAIVNTLTSEETQVVYLNSTRTTDAITFPFFVKVTATNPDVGDGPVSEELQIDEDLSPPDIVHPTSSSSGRIEFIDSNTTLLDTSDNGLIIVEDGGTPQTIQLTLGDNLPNGYTVQVLNDKNNQSGTIVEFLVTNNLSANNKTTIATGSAAILKHAGNGDYTIFTDDFVGSSIIIEENGNVQPSRNTLNFTGEVNVTDDPANNRLNINIKQQFHDSSLIKIEDVWLYSN